MSLWPLLNNSIRLWSRGCFFGFFLRVDTVAHPAAVCAVVRVTVAHVRCASRAGCDCNFWFTPASGAVALRLSSRLIPSASLLSQHSALRQAEPALWLCLHSFRCVEFSRLPRTLRHAPCTRSFRPCWSVLRPLGPVAPGVRTPLLILSASARTCSIAALKTHVS